ncbi:MAG TPA: dodecin family protein [Rubrobacteraceae bacterium]|nr:dodecin family protein [Rubrobacteraceae bacterium]
MTAFARTKKEKHHTTTVARVTEISATSPKGLEAAIEEGIERANKTLRNIESAWVKEALHQNLNTMHLLVQTTSFEPKPPLAPLKQKAVLNQKSGTKDGGEGKGGYGPHRPAGSATGLPK